MSVLEQLVQRAQRTGERLTIVVTGNVVSARWSRGRGRHVDQVVDYHTPELEDVVEVLGSRVLQQEAK